MKNLYLGFVLVTLLSCLSSCSNYGYPSKVVMPTMGGKQEVSGDEFCYSIGIRDASGKGSNSKEEWAEGPDTLCIKYDWLTVKTVRFKPILIFEAQPNNTGNQRELYVDGLVDNHSTDIKVIQN